MANRRMVSKTIIDSDMFLDMPLSAQCLYFHLLLRADDDGFVSNPRKIMRMIGSNDDELRILFAKQYIIGFESGIIVIKHWKIHNWIAPDRYTPSVYTKEKSEISMNENKEYVLQDVLQPVLQDVLQPVDTGKVRLGQVSSDKDSIDKKNARFTPPTIEEVHDYCMEHGYKVDAEAFVNFYESKGWMVGKNHMKKWQSAVANWARRDAEKKPAYSKPAYKPYVTDEIDLSIFEE